MSPLYIYNGKLLINDGKLATNQNCCCIPVVSGCETIICVTIDYSATIYEYNCDGFVPPDCSWAENYQKCFCEARKESCNYEEVSRNATIKLYFARVNNEGQLDRNVPFSHGEITCLNNMEFPEVPFDVRDGFEGCIDPAGIYMFITGVNGNYYSRAYISLLAYDSYGCLCHQAHFGLDNCYTEGSADEIDFSISPCFTFGNEPPLFAPCPVDSYAGCGHFDPTDPCFDPIDTTTCESWEINPILTNLVFTSCFGQGASGFVSSPVKWDDLAYPNVDPPDGFTLGPGPIDQITITNGGSGYAKIGRIEPTLTISGGSGFGIIIDNITLLETKNKCNLPTWGLSSIECSQGIGYVDNEVLQIIPEPGDTTEVAGIIRVKTVANSEPTLSAYIGSAPGAVVSVSMESIVGSPPRWGVDAVIVSSPLSGYTDGEKVSFNFNQYVFQQTKAIANVATARVEPNNINISVGGGEGACFTVNMIESSGSPYDDQKIWSVSTVDVHNGGYGYSGYQDINGQIFPGDTVYFNIGIPDSGMGGYPNETIIATSASATVRTSRVNPNLTPYIYGSAGNGGIFSATMVSNNDDPETWGVSNISIINGGSGYQVGEYFWFNELDPIIDSNPPYYFIEYDGWFITEVDENGKILSLGLDPMYGNGKYYKDSGIIESIEILDGGQYYTTSNNLSRVVIGNPGAYYYNNGIPTGIFIENPGKYYREDTSIPGIPSSVTISLTQTGISNGDGAILSPVIDTDFNSPTFGKITSVNINNGGDDYYGGYLSPGSAPRNSGGNLTVTISSSSPDPSEYSIVDGLLTPRPCDEGC